MPASSRISTSRVYSGRILSLDIDRVRFPDGSEGELEMIRHPGASAVLPFLSDPVGPDPEILLIRQFRHAAEGFLYEVPAGRLDPGESPQDCARRELAEETGYSARALWRMTTIYTTPGFTDEQIHLFVASDLVQGNARHERDEFIETRGLRLSTAMGMIRAGEIADGKTLVAILHADHLRQVQPHGLGMSSRSGERHDP